MKILMFSVHTLSGCFHFNQKLKLRGYKNKDAGIVNFSAGLTCRPVVIRRTTKLSL